MTIGVDAAFATDGSSIASVAKIAPASAIARPASTIVKSAAGVRTSVIVAEQAALPLVASPARQRVAARKPAVAQTASSAAEQIPLISLFAAASRAVAAAEKAAVAVAPRSAPERALKRAAGLDAEAITARA